MMVLMRARRYERALSVRASAMIDGSDERVRAERANSIRGDAAEMMVSLMPHDMLRFFQPSSAFSDVTLFNVHRRFFRRASRIGVGAEEIRCYSTFRRR